MLRVVGIVVEDIFIYRAGEAPAGIPGGGGEDPPGGWGGPLKHDFFKITPIFKKDPYYSFACSPMNMFCILNLSWV